MSKEIAIPEYLKKFIGDTSTSSTDDMITESAGSVPRISVRGKKFRVTIGSEAVKKPSDELFVVILGVDPAGGLFNKAYFEDDYTGPNEDAAPPRCTSQDGIKPDSWIADPVHHECATCPMNMFKSARVGKGKACKDSKILWVSEPDDIEGNVYALKVNISSIKNMSEYARLLKSNAIPPAAVITKLSFNDDADYPLIEFEYVGVLEEETLKLAMTRSEEQDWMGPKTSQSALDAPKKAEALESPKAKKAAKPKVLDEEIEEALGDW